MFLLLNLSGCEKEQNEGNSITPAELAGDWLVSTFDNENQTIFKITEIPFDFCVEFKTGESTLLGFGNWISVKGDVVSGKYVTQNQEFKEFSWKVKDLKPLDITIEETGENGTETFTLYRMMSEIDLECSTSHILDYESMTGATGFLEFSVTDGAIADIDPRTGELFLRESSGFTYIIVKTTSGTCVVPLKTHKGKQLNYSGEVWVCDLPSEKRWIRMITYPDEKKVRVHRSEYGKSFVMYESLTGNYDQEGDDITLTLTGSTLQQPEKHNLELKGRTDTEMTVNAVESGRKPMVFRRLLNSYVLMLGNKQRPNYRLNIGDHRIQGFKSHDEKIATVDETGEITGVGEGITFVDVITDKGVLVVEVDVDGGIIPYPFEEIFSTEDPEYLTSNKNPYCHILNFVGNSDEPSIMHASNSFSDAHPLFIKLSTSFVGILGPTPRPLYSIGFTYVQSVNKEEVIRACDERYTKLESETTQDHIIYINAKELSDATVKISILLKTFQWRNISVSYTSLKKRYK